MLPNEYPPPMKPSNQISEASNNPDKKAPLTPSYMHKTRGSSRGSQIQTITTCPRRHPHDLEDLNARRDNTLCLVVHTEVGHHIHSPSYVAMLWIEAGWSCARGKILRLDGHSHIFGNHRHNPP